MSLCRERAIPGDYHLFYNSLCHDADVHGKLPETDIDDDEEDIVE